MTEPERRATLKTGEKRRSAPLVLAEALILLAILALAGVLLRQGYRRYMETVYPLKYAAFVNRAAEEYDFEPSLLFAMIYTESGFDPAAKSKAGAMGLMQLLPSTFEEVAGRLRETPELTMISNPVYSIRYGTFYISYLIRYFGNEETAIAAYNAGIGNVRSWLADSRYSDDGKTLKAYPYRETENYVNKVVAAREKYKSIIGDVK